MITTNIWETFLPVSRGATSDLAPAADAAWLASKGIEAQSPMILRQLRLEVLPLVRRLEAVTSGLRWYSFLIHDGASGVPTAPDDKSIYVHLRLAFLTAADIDLPAEWLMTRRTELSREIAGVDTSALDIDAAWEFLGAQSALLLRLIELHGDKADDLAVLKHVKQFWHYFANMVQMRVA
jgi:hypothetical protein